MIKNTEQIEYKKMDKARAGRPPSKVAYIAYMRHFCFEFNMKSPIYTEISTVTFFYIAYAVILLAFHVKKAYTAYKPKIVQL